MLWQLLNLKVFLHVHCIKMKKLFFNPCCRVNYCRRLVIFLIHFRVSFNFDLLLQLYSDKDVTELEPLISRKWLNQDFEWDISWWKFSERLIWHMRWHFWPPWKRWDTHQPNLYLTSGWWFIHFMTPWWSMRFMQTIRCWVKTGNPLLWLPVMTIINANVLKGVKLVFW